jgi:uncharacterized membrane protein (Fun14 family)
VKGGVDLLISPKFRQWLYGVALMGVPILIVYGVVSVNDAALWLALAGAVLGQGTAFAALAQQRKAAAPAATSDSYTQPG